MAEKKVRKKTARKTTVRKAPSRVSVKSGVKEKKNFTIYITVGILIFLSGISFVIGNSDKGQINVSDTISEKIKTATPEEKEKIKNIPVQRAKNNVPDGGLIPTTDVDPDIKPEVIEKSVGTSTEDVSTSTEDVATSTSNTNSVEEDQQKQQIGDTEPSS